MGWLTRHISFLERIRADLGQTFTLRFSGVGRFVFVSDPASVRKLFGSDSDHRLPAGRALLLEPVLGRSSLLLLEGRAHLERRKLMLPPFHGERMRRWEEEIRAIAAADVDGWPRGDPFAVRSRMQAITLEVILRIVFGVEPGPRSAELREGLAAMLAHTRRTLRQFLSTFAARLGPLSPLGSLERSVAQVDALIAAEIADRRRTDVRSREDVLSMLIAARFESGEGLSDAELRDQLMTLLVAGHETTATALSWSIDMLNHNPRVAERARRAVGEGDDEYLLAIGREAQRLRPVIPSVGRELGTPADFDGFEIEGGENVMVSTYLLHTRADLYPDPHAFRPERFVGRRPDPNAWMPFGGGVRRCLGAAFAELELRVVLSEVLDRVSLRAAGQAPERSALPGVTLLPRGGAPVIAS